jgi:hypothetical protein
MASDGAARGKGLSGGRKSWCGSTQRQGEARRAGKTGARPGEKIAHRRQEMGEERANNSDLKNWENGGEFWG